MSEEIKVSSDGKFFMVLKAAMNLPGVRIKREDFLRKELRAHFKEDIVNNAIEKSPAQAGITVDQLENISKSCIEFETKKVSAISAAAGIPGGTAMIGTVPADITQYFAHIVRILQKLVYLYGWEELYNSDEDFDDETVNLLTLFIGVMFGVNAANAAITKVAQSAAIRTEKSLAAKALTKGVIYPVVKQVAKILGIKMTKETFAKGVSKVIPILGGVLSGGLTYISFKPSALKLKKYLITLPMADVEFYKARKVDYVDVEHVVIEEDKAINEEGDE